MSDDISDAIDANLASPASASVDGNSAATKPVGEIIEGDKYKRAIRAGRRPPWGITIGKIVSPGGAE